MQILTAVLTTMLVLIGAHQIIAGTVSLITYWHLFSERNPTPIPTRRAGPPRQDTPP